jgi:hypothetical protein
MNMKPNYNRPKKKSPRSRPSYDMRPKKKSPRSFLSDLHLLPRDAATGGIPCGGDCLLPLPGSSTS